MNSWTADPRALLADRLERVNELPRQAEARSLAFIEALEDDPARLLSPALVLATSLPVALLIGVPTAGVGAGVLIGGLIAGASYLRMRQRERAAMAKLEQSIADAWVDADQRVAVITKQYEWAVNDVANLRDALRRTQARALEAEGLRRTSSPVPLVRSMAAQDTATVLRFETDGVAPAQIRVLEDDAVVGISARFIEPATGDIVSFAVSVAERVAAGVARGDQRFVLEALVGEEWRRVVIRRQHNPREAVSDKRGRVYSGPTIPPLLAFTVAD